MLVLIEVFLNTLILEYGSLEIQKCFEMKNLIVLSNVVYSFNIISKIHLRHLKTMTKSCRKRTIKVIISLMPSVQDDRNIIHRNETLISQLL